MFIWIEWGSIMQKGVDGCRGKRVILAEIVVVARLRSWRMLFLVKLEARSLPDRVRVA
jgi:hypothetical protein